MTTFVVVIILLLYEVSSINYHFKTLVSVFDCTVAQNN